MSFLDSLGLHPAVSIFLIAIVAMIVLYISRKPAHRAIISLTRVVHNAMRLSAKSVMSVESRLANRNREVLLAAGREAEERMIEREFERIDATVRRDLSEYPAMHPSLPWCANGASVDGSAWLRLIRVGWTRKNL